MKRLSPRLLRRARLREPASSSLCGKDNPEDQHQGEHRFHRALSALMLVGAYVSGCGSHAQKRSAPAPGNGGMGGSGSRAKFTRTTFCSRPIT
jgi:hypothetical protein